MSKTRHTKGPWAAEWGVRDGDGTEEQWNIVPADEKRAGIDGPIADLGVSDGFRSYGENAANARLMAAAPELLAACVMVLERYETLVGAMGSRIAPGSVAPPEISAIRAAIASAVGNPTPAPAEAP